MVAGHMAVPQFRGPITYCVLQWCHPMLTGTQGGRAVAPGWSPFMVIMWSNWIQARAGCVVPGGRFQGRGCLPWVRCISACTEADTVLWTEWLTDACENITLPQLSLRAVIIPSCEAHMERFDSANPAGFETVSTVVKFLKSLVYSAWLETLTYLLFSPLTRKSHRNHSNSWFNVVDLIPRTLFSVLSLVQSVSQSSRHDIYLTKTDRCFAWEDYKRIDVSHEDTTKFSWLFRY